MPAKVWSCVRISLLPPTPMTFSDRWPLHKKVKQQEEEEEEGKEKSERVRREDRMVRRRRKSWGGKNVLREKARREGARMIKEVRQGKNGGCVRRGKKRDKDRRGEKRDKEGVLDNKNGDTEDVLKMGEEGKDEGLIEV